MIVASLWLVSFYWCFSLSFSLSVGIVYPVSVFQSQVAQEALVSYNYTLNHYVNKALSASIVLSLKEGTYQSKDTQEKTMRIYQQNITLKKQKLNKQTNNNNSNRQQQSEHLTGYILPIGSSLDSFLPFIGTANRHVVLRHRSRDFQYDDIRIPLFCLFMIKK